MIDHPGRDQYINLEWAESDAQMIVGVSRFVSSSLHLSRLALNLYLYLNLNAEHVLEMETQCPKAFKSSSVV